MRSNVRKMWTALLAVLFAVAVGFGLWFAFAPAARPSNVHAAEEPSVTFTVDSSKTLYSWYPTTGLISNRFIKGTIDLADGSTAQNLQAYAEKTTFNIYKQVENEGQTTYQKVSDFRPDAGVSPNSTYTRYIEAVVALDDGRTITSEKKAVTVTADEITSFEASAVGQQTTFYALETVSEERLIVQAMYKNGGMSNILEIPMAQLDEDGKPLYGGWYIVYQQEEGKTEEEDSSKYLEYGDTYFTVYYKEGNQEKNAKVNINVIEAYVNAPVTPSLSNFEYDETSHSNTFTGYDAEKMTYSLSGEGVSASRNEDNFVVSATNVGTYSVTFTVKEGYQFLNTPAGATGKEATRVDGTTYLQSVTYTWKIEKASITKVEIEFPERWEYSETPTLPQDNSIALTTDPSITGLNAASDSVMANVTFNYTDTAGYNSTTLPENAGEYTWTVSLTGMKNFKDFNGTDGNGGSGSFVIEKKTLSVPALESTKPAYTGEAQSATAGEYDSTLMTFDGDLDGEERINVGTYHATFTLTDPDNYKWKEGATVSGEKEEVATVTWEIIQAENKATVTIEGWTYGETAKSPSFTADFGAGTVTFSYSGQTNAGEEYNSTSAPTEAGSYTVTATIAETTNYEGATATDTFEVLRAPIGLPSFTESTFSYNGQYRTPVFSASVSGFTHDLAAKKDAGSYTVTATLDGNHQWSTEKDSSYVYEYELTWSITAVPISIEGTLSIAGWTYGSTPNDPSDMSIAESSKSFAASGGDTLTGEYLYYDSNDSSARPLEGIPSAAGTYYVRYHAYSNTENFTEAYSQFVSFTIAQKEVTVSWRNTGLTYNGTVQTPTAETSDFELGDDVSLTVTGGQKNAGTNYTATASLADDDAKNYVLKAGTATASFSIAKKTIGIEWGTLEFIYNGQPQQPTAEPTGVVDDDTLTLTVSVEGEHANAGSYTATASLAGTDAGNYSLPDNAKKEFVIHKATVSVGDYISEPEGYEGTNLYDRQIVYSGVLETSQLIIKTSDLFREGDRKDSEGQISTAVTVGQYSVTLTLNDANNYKWSGGSDDEISGAEIVVKYSITQSQFLITVSFDRYTWTYGGTAGTPSIAVNISKGAESFAYYATKEDAEKKENALGAMPTDAGTYWVVGTVAATDDYAQSVSAPVSFTINKVEIGIAWGSETSFIYNGKPQAPTATATGAVNGEVLTLTLKGQATNVGTHTAVVTGIDGKAATNYQLPEKGLEKQFTITQRAINVTLNEYTVTYNGAAFSGSFTTEGHANNGQTLFTVAEGELCGSDTLEGTFTYPKNAINAGSYAWGDIAWSNTNYAVTVTYADTVTNDQAFTIDPAEITVTINSKSYEYGLFRQTDEQLQSLYTVNGLVIDSDSVTVTLSYSKDGAPVTLPKNVGTYTVSASISGNPNYVLAETDVQEGTLTITKKTLTIKGPTSTIEYGEAAPRWDVANDVTYGGLGFDDDKALLDKLITLGTEYKAGNEVTSYDITVNVGTGEILNNYTVQSENGSLIVTPREITVTIQDVTTTYGTKGELSATASREDGKTAIFGKDDPYELALYNATLSENLNAGKYIIYGTATDDNYSITFKGSQDYNGGTKNAGLYLVNPQALTITYQFTHLGQTHSSGSALTYDGAAWEVNVYAESDPDITFDVTYEVKGQNGQYSALGTSKVPTDAGSYRFVVEAGQVSGNYQANQGLSVEFTIAQREVEAVWLVDGAVVSDYSLGYNGDTGYTITAQYYGWTNGGKNAEPTSLTVTKPSDFRNVGSYSFTATFATDDEKGNYKFGEEDDEDSVTHEFKIIKAPITVKIKPQTSIYGEAIVSPKVPADMAAENSLYTIEGKIYDNADTIFSLSTEATSTSDAGEYAITGTATGTNSNNYAVTFVNAEVSTSKVGTYTVTRRPVVIDLEDFEMIYGTDISAVDNHEKLVSLSGLDFTLGDGTTGDPFLTEDSGAEAAAKSAMNFGFADTSGTYDAQSAANTTWTVTASLSDQASDDLKNYTFVEGASTMTVIPRPISVTLPELGSTSYTYGTGALQNAFETFEATVSIDDEWKGYGEPIVFNDNAAGGVYTLVVKNEKGEEITLSALTPVGTYTLAGKAGGDSNYSVTFTAEQTFEVTEAQFKVNAQDPVSVSVVYTGENYYFRSDAEAKENPADTYLFDYGLSVTTANFVLSKENIAYTWEFKVGDNSLTYLTDAGTYKVDYTVTAKNFKTVTGSFTVEITQATNEWTAGMTTTDGGAYEQVSWTYGDPEKYSSLNWTDTFEGYAPSTQFVAAFGDVHIEYYKTRSGGPSEYTYSDQITDPGTFFGCETAVGTYYVKVYVTETDDYKGLTAHGTIVVNQRAVDIDWAANNITVNGETHEGTNTTIGFDKTLMTVDTESLPQGLTIVDGPSATGEITVNVKAEGTTQFYLYFELIDPDNYCWEESATVSGDKDERIQINFTTNALQNNVTFKGQDGDLSQNTGISISFGTELRYKFATSSGDTIGDAHLLIFADSTLAGETLNYYISFARTAQGDEEPIDDSYTLATLEGADAGCYWLRVQVYPTSDSSYGYGIGYLKICVTQLEITQDVIDGIDFGLSGDELHFTYDGRPHQPSAEGVPSYLHVTFSGSATNVWEGDVTVTATFTIADDNYKFKDGVSPTREIVIVIDPAEITRIVWSDREYTYNGTDQTGDVYAYFVDVFGVEHRLKVTLEDGTFMDAGEYTFTAELALYEAQEGFCIENYKFADNLAELTHVYKMAKATVEIGIGDAEAVYTGEPIEIDQTQYALRTAISLSDPEILAFLNQIHLIAVDDDGNPAVNVGSYKIILEKEEWAYTNIEIVFNDSYAGQLTVSPAVLEVPVLDETQFVYNGSVQKPNVTGVDGVYTVENKGGTDVGTYSVTFTLVTENYYWATEEENVDTVTLTYKIVQAEYSFSVSIEGWTYNKYDETANAPSVTHETTKPDEAQLNYLYTGKTNGGTSYNSKTAPTEAGSYTLTVTISGMHNYKDAEESAEFTIERAPIEVSLTFKPKVDDGNGWVYGTTPEDIYELDKSSNPGGGVETETYSTGSWSGNEIPTEVGEYTLTVTVAETNNYESGSASVEFKIVRASEGQLSFTVTIESWTYGYKPNAPSVVKDGSPFLHPAGILPTYTYAPVNEDNTFGKFSPTTPTNAGRYVVKATFVQTANYSELSAMCKFTIGKAAASIDTSGVKTNFTYNGRAQAVGGAVLDHSETTLVYSPATVTAVGSYTVTISAAESTNYTAATATVTVTVSRASAGFSVRIDDWTYGETPSRYTISGGSGGSVSVTYSGTTNAGVKYSSSKAPTEAGEYTITVVMGASGNFLGGTARDSFTIHRAKAEAELSLAGWMYGEEPNAYVLTPEFLRGEVVRVIYTDGTYYSEAVPKEVGSYTITVIYAETDNYLGGEVSCKFSIVPYGLGLTVTLEGWTYGDKANEPIVTGARGIGLMYAYTGTANDGTVWNSNTAPEKAGSYTLTVTVIEAGNYTGESASTDFVIARRLLSAPAWDEEGMRELIEVCSGDRMTRAILGFDMSLMNAQSATAQFMFGGTGAASVTANIHGVYTIVVSLRDAANYGWADLNEGETLTGPVTLTWTLTERVISLLWLIILLAVLIVIALIVLIVLLKKGGKPDGTDTEEGGKPDGTDTGKGGKPDGTDAGKGDVRLSSVAPVGLLLVVAPLGEIIAAVALGVVLLAVVIADIAVGVRNAKRAKAAENAQEPVLSYCDEAAAEGEAYFGTEVPADDGAEVASDEGEAYPGTEVPADEEGMSE